VFESIRVEHFNEKWRGKRERKKRHNINTKNQQMCVEKDRKAMKKL
jgi:hypothetical protein